MVASVAKSNAASVELATPKSRGTPSAPTTKATETRAPFPAARAVRMEEAEACAVRWFERIFRRTALER